MPGLQVCFSTQDEYVVRRMITNGQNTADAVAGDIPANDGRFSPGGFIQDRMVHGSHEA